ncbi:unnamed protein product [Oppiella nova]|uniref:UDP-glycosyltransferase n=1 Tax=Oppiella nova TaxID=334625 RepID=A0A7R9M6M4_9ACAR|nr:unnamed protein product [Oppiella nova]CAG2170445.1 unnamed protein product [Oppiella nova]
MLALNTKRTMAFASRIKRLDPFIKQTIDTLKPDVIVVDHVLCIPAVEVSGIPWVLTCSCNPLFLIENNCEELTPPKGSGFAKQCMTRRVKYGKSLMNTLCPMERNPYQNLYFNPSPYLNIYPFPKELDYTDVRPLPPNTYQFDNFIHIKNDIPFEIPVPLRDKPGKLVYLSLGSMGAADVKNMKRLVTILSKSKHRFIVSKGPLQEEYDLPVNMWGAATVPQLQVLPVVDLVITHGGNNTIVETMYFGKAMIVLPLFGDQYDNAERVECKGFGKRLDAYQCSESELLTAIDSLLNDKELEKRLSKISQRIQSDKSSANLPGLLENLLAHK